MFNNNDKNQGRYMREPKSIRIKVTFHFYGMISDENGLNASYTFICTVEEEEDIYLTPNVQCITYQIIKK